MNYNKEYLEKIIACLKEYGDLRISWHKDDPPCQVYDIPSLSLALELHLNYLRNYAKPKHEKHPDHGKLKSEDGTCNFYYAKKYYTTWSRANGNTNNVSVTFDHHFLGNGNANVSHVIAFLIMEIFDKFTLTLPPDSSNQIPGSLEELYSTLYPARTAFDDICWEDVCNNQKCSSLKQQVIRYFFDIDSTADNSVPEIKLQLAEWQCFTPAMMNLLDKKTYTDLLYQVAGELIRTAKTVPMYEYLLSKPAEACRDDLREIFKHTAYREIDGTLVLHSPVASISRWMTELVRAIAMNETFTVYDFLSFAGRLAAFAKDCENHIITPDELEKFKGSNFGKEENHLLEAVKKLPFISKDDKENLRFTIRPYRLILAGLYDSWDINQTDLTPQQILERYIEPYFPTGNDNDDNVRLDHVSFHQNHDSYIFYVMSLLYNLNSGIRRELIRQICTNAKNFSVLYRLTQICYIYILTNVLSSELPLCSAQRNEIFFTAFSQTLYEFQASHWKYLDKSSRYYREEVIRTVEAACSYKNKPESAELNDSHKNDNQPYYMLLYGLLVSEEYLTSDRVENDDLRKKISAHLQKMKEAVQFVDQELSSDRKVLESSSVFFLKYAAFLQSQTWYPSDGLKIDQSVLIHDLHEMLEIASCWFKAHSRPSTAMAQLTFGVQLLGYCLADLVNYHHLNSNDIWGSNEAEVNARQTNALTSLIYADYWMRHTNAKYPAGIGDGHLLCGTYRSICAVAFESVTEKVILTENMLKEYRSWLSAESNNTATRRYAYLMALLLHHTDFPLESDTYRTRTLLAVLLQELRTILKEEDYSIFLQYDLGAGMKKLLGTPIPD